MTLTSSLTTALRFAVLTIGALVAGCSSDTSDSQQTADLAPASRAQTQAVGIATSNPGSIFHNIGTAVANAANSEGLNTTIQSATSPNQYIPLVNSGRVEFGIANLQEVNYSLDGSAWFAGNANPNLRVVGLIMPVRSAIFVRADSDIRTVVDLQGRRMVDGFTAQQAMLPQLDAMYSTAGLTRADMRSVQVPSVVAGADAFMAGDSDGFLFAHGAGKVREADAAVGGLRALPIEDTEENLRRMREHWPTAFFVRMQPSLTLPGVEEPATFLAYPQVVFTHAGVADDIVYQMAKALYENKRLMTETFSAFNLFEPEQLVGDTAPSEYHPGAVEFYREVGLWKDDE